MLNSDFSTDFLEDLPDQPADPHQDPQLSHQDPYLPLPLLVLPLAPMGSMFPPNTFHGVELTATVLAED